MKSWIYKQYLQLVVPIRNNPKMFISYFFSIFGVLLTFSEIQQVFWESTGIILWVRSNIIKVLLLGLIISICRLREKTCASCFLGTKDVKITLQLSNIFHHSNCAIVIPTNSTFDTIMDEEFISIRSIQGQYQKKYCKGNLEDLNRSLQSSLEGQYLKHETLTNRRDSKILKYELGSVAKIFNRGKHYYFLAVADVNSKGKPENVTMMSVTRILVSFWDYLQKAGHSEPVVIPVIATGHAGLSDGTLEDVVRETITTFAMASQESFIAKKLIISVYPSTLKESNVRWEDLCDYLSLKCKFYNDMTRMRDQNSPKGQAIE